jgi:hypothetical protein
VEHACLPSDELSSNVPSSSFVDDVSSSPSVDPSSPADSSLEQLIRCSHRIRLPLTITLCLLSQPLLFLDQLLIVMLFFIRNGSTRWLRRLLHLIGLTRGILCPIPHISVRSLVSRSL